MNKKTTDMKFRDTRTATIYGNINVKIIARLMLL